MAAVLDEFVLTLDIWSMGTWTYFLRRSQISHPVSVKYLPLNNCHPPEAVGIYREVTQQECRAALRCEKENLRYGISAADAARYASWLLLSRVLLF